MRSKLSVLFVFFFSLLLWQCKEKEKHCPDCDCPNFPEVTGPGGTGDIRVKQQQTITPYFNPNNSNEIVYIEEDRNVHQLIKYNLLTKAKQVLFTYNSYIGEPKWNKKGWILFNGIENQIYLIKDNGDSLKRIQCYLGNHYPSFINGDTAICYSVNIRKDQNSVGTKFMNFKGKVYDSTKVSEGGVQIGINSINNKKEILTQQRSQNLDGSFIIGYNWLTKHINHYQKLEKEVNYNVNGISWHPNNEKFYYSIYQNGIFLYNTLDYSVERIVIGCQTKYYSHLSVSPDGTQIVAERVDCYDFRTSDGAYTQESNIVIMDINGQNERYLFK